MGKIDFISKFKAKKKIIIFSAIGALSLITLTTVLAIVVKNKKTESKNKKIKEHLKIINSIDDSDIKLIDDVGIQYKQSESIKNLKLINPSWVKSVSLDKNKLINSEKKQVNYSISLATLKVSDLDGSISYIVELKLDEVSKALTISYDNLPKKHNDETKVGTPLNGFKVISNSKEKQQYYINKYRKEKNGDISEKNIIHANFEGIDLLGIKKLPKKLDQIKWSGFINLDLEKIKIFKLQGDQSKNEFSFLTNHDVSLITKWPEDLRYINWPTNKGLSKYNTPFKGNISYRHKIWGSNLYGVDVSKVTKWPYRMNKVNFNGAIGITADNTFFKGDISAHVIQGILLYGVDVSKVTKWPSGLGLGSGSDAPKWKGVKCTLKSKPVTWTNHVWNKVQEAITTSKQISSKV